MDNEHEVKFIICLKCITLFEYYKVCDICFHCSAAEAFVLLGYYTVTNTFSTQTLNKFPT